MEAGFFGRGAAVVASELIGCTLLHRGVGGVIVEVEAYDLTDPASHSFSGPTRRNASMFGPAGHAYVYRSYGMHWCVNIVCERGSAVLVRALEPTRGLDAMADRRGTTRPRLLCSGPGRLCQALAIGAEQDGEPFDREASAAALVLLARAEPAAVVTGPRIGITKGADTPWRFALAGSPFLSRPLRAFEPAPTLSVEAAVP